MDDVFEFLHSADEQLEKHGNAIEAATKVGITVHSVPTSTRKTF